jgi:DGQHR domain-containing protein
MPRYVTAAAKLAAYERNLERYQRIKTARDSGRTLQDIAHAEGLSRERVRQILAQGEPDWPTRIPEISPEADLQPTASLARRGETKMATATIAEARAEYIVSDLPRDPQLRIHTMVVPGRVAFATMTPDAMDRLFFISRYSVEDDESPAPAKHGYQRDPLQERIPQIADYYLGDDHGYLVTPLIISVRLRTDHEIERFKRLFDDGQIEQIHAEWNHSLVSVVDGQHRYLGLVRAHELEPDFMPPVPMMFYFGLSYIEEADLFDVINVTQRKLPRALIEVTKGDITESDSPSHAQIIRGIAFSIARDTDSVWFGEINMTGARDPDRRVTYEGLRRSTANMLPATVIQRLQDRNLTPEGVAKDYWRMVSEACAIAWQELPRTVINEEGEPAEIRPAFRLKDLVGVAALSKLGKDIILSALEHSDFDRRMHDLVSRLQEVDWEKRKGNPWMASQAGFAGQKDLYEVLYQLVYRGVRPGEAVEP